jgi:hypothetical protein
MARDIYDDPRIQSEDDDYIRMEQIGDGCQGTVTALEVIDAQFGAVLKVTLRAQGGREVSFLAGSRNLSGQMMTKRPRPGDFLAVKLVELRPSGPGRSPLKVFEVNVTPPEPSGPGSATAQPDDDLFAS